MKKFFMIAAIITLCFSAMSFAAISESIVLYRAPSSGWFVFNPDGTAGNWIDYVIDQQVSFGWPGIAGVAFADINGDGIDDKVMWQPASAQWQFIVATSTASGDISNTDFSGNGYLQTEWWNNAVQVPIFGDFNGDGVDDNGITSSGADLLAGGGVDGSLVWGHWLSVGPGISGSTNPHTGWSIFGEYGVDQPLVGDINADGVDDRILWRSSNATVYVDYSNPAGGYGDSVADTQYSFGMSTDKIAIADINGDGYEDVVVVRDMRGIIAEPNDFYTLYGYYSGPAGISQQSTPDMITSVGTPSLGDAIMFAKLVPEVLCPTADLDGDCDVDTADLAVMAENWLALKGIENFSFEEDAVADGTTQAYVFNGESHPDYNYLNIPKFWDINGTTGQLVNPLDTDALQASDGSNYAVIDGGNLAQFPGRYATGTIDPNTVYTITVDVSATDTFGWFWTKLISLDDSNGLVFTTLSEATHVSHGTPPVGRWTTITLSWSSETAPQLVNTHLLFSIEGQGVAYDNIRYKSTSYPVDFNGDTFINYVDFAALASEWLTN